jgi:hypothetical protein
MISIGAKQYACLYADQGWPVICLVAGQKFPDAEFSPHGANSGTTDIGEIAAWPADCNVGLVMGPASRLVTVDFDDPQAFDRLRYNGYEVDKTVRSRTFRGEHWIFRLPVCIDEPVSFDIVPGVDIKAGGYIVAPPSIHPDGPQYSFFPDMFDGSTFYLEDAPDWLVYHIQRRIKDRQRVIELSEEAKGLFKLVPEAVLCKALSIRWWAVNRAVAGSCRHNTAVAMACRLRDNGTSPMAARGHMMDFAADVSRLKKRDISAHEMEGIVEWAYSQPVKAPEYDMQASIWQATRKTARPAE